jgi:hypothetical protein
MTDGLMIKDFPRSYIRDNDHAFLIQDENDDYGHILLQDLLAGQVAGSFWQFPQGDIEVTTFPYKAFINNSSGIITITLPASAPDGSELTIKLSNNNKALITGITKLNNIPVLAGDIVSLKYVAEPIVFIYSANYESWFCLIDNVVSIIKPLVLPTTGLTQKFFASDILAVNDSSIGQWNDTVTGRHSTQSITANRPIYKTGIFNNSELPSVYFDGNDFLQTDLTYLAGQKYIIAIAEARVNANQGYILGNDASSTNAALHIGYSANTTFRLGQFGNDLDGTITGYSTFNPSILILTNIASGKEIWRNGTRIANNTNTTNLVSAINGRIGRALNSVHYTGHIGLIATYTGNNLPSVSELFTAINNHYKVY